MKRSEALTSLSHDHHQALTMALRLRRSQPETAAADREELQRFWPGHERHLQIEEEILLPAFGRQADADQSLAERARAEHDEMRRRAADILANDDTGAAQLAQFGELLNDHVRMEERELFPLIEQALPPDELATLAEQLHEADAGGTDRVQFRP